MYVKELTLRGFKSFANPTTLRFEPGVTAIIGPNGSGKSNIVDALAWVMGEQGAKSLRGTSMEDVIFAGTSTRPPMGRAQVSLTIDNSDGTLDIEYSEVTISRTIYRNGGSEYAINGSPVRLLDVQELLSDTGLGAHMHVVVGQGRLDSILRATPADNRGFIEEAAGILKHRKRKERALRKLQNTQENLDRLDDLLKEIHRQLGPLRRQARISKRADSIHVALRDAQCRLYADDASKLQASRDEVRDKLSDVRSRLGEQQRELAATKVQIERLEAMASESSPALQRLSQSWHELGQVQERLESLSRLAQERARSFESQIAQPSGDDPEMLARRADELDAQATESQSDATARKLELEKATEARAEAEKQLASIRQTLTELRRTSQERDARIAKLREQIAREQALVQSDTQRKTDADGQRATFETQLAEARERLESLESTVRDTGESESQAELDMTREACDKARQTRDAAANEQRKLDSEAIGLQAKADALDDTLNSHDGSADLAANGVATLGRLADWITVDDGWEDAMAHALGPFAGAVVLPGYPDVVKALDGLDGKAVMLSPCTDQGAGAGGAAADASRPAMPAGTRPAGELIGPSPHATAQRTARGVVASLRILLSDVLVADTVESAESALAADGAGWSQAVTRDGRMLNAVGGIAGGTSVPSDISLAARRDKALELLADVTRRRDEATSRLDEANQAYAQARSVVDAAKARVTERRVKAQEARRNLEAASSSVSSLERRVQDVQRRIAQIEQEADGRRRNIDSLNDELDVAQSTKDEQMDFDEVQAREKSLESELSQQRESEIRARIAWSDADKRYQSLVRQSGMLRDNARQARERRIRVEARNERLAKQAHDARCIGDLAAAAARRMAAHIEHAQTERERVQSEASAHDSELAQLRKHRNEIEPVVSGLQNDEHDLDVRRERLATEFGGLRQKVSDDLGMDMDELIADFGPDVPVPVLDDEGHVIELEDATETASGEDAGADGSADADAGRPRYDGARVDPARYKTVPYVRDEQTRRLATARRDLEALGKVNPLAGEEYDALEARNKYINDQRQDVVKSRDDLLGLIKDLDGMMVDVFTSAFNDTAAAFEKVFATLFPGGTGHLRLENPDDMLATGVIVEASPAGKRVKQLSLLSGGERSLTALALLFAIFTARPSPFYIMDEVEAALDDVNLTRLLNAIDDLRSHAQLIIITHQQRTMSIADALYGVTMRADGVTSVVSTTMRRDGRPSDDAAAQPHDA